MICLPATHVDAVGAEWHISSPSISVKLQQNRKTCHYNNFKIRLDGIDVIWVDGCFG
jgi:hypothetical protein